MADETTVFTLDGVTDFTAWDREFAWAGGFIEHIEAMHTVGVAHYSADVALDGGWATNGLSFGTNDVGQKRFDVTITDSDDPAYRFIRTISLDNPSPRSRVDITLDRANVDTVLVGDATLNFTLGANSIRYLEGRLGDDTVNGARGADAGRFESVNLGEGDNTFDSRGSTIRTLVMYDDDDTVTIRNGVDFLSVGGGTNIVDILGGESYNITSFSGDNTIRVVGAETEVRTIGVSGGRDDLTVDAAQVLVATLGSNDDTVIVQNAGGIDLLRLSNGTNAATVTGEESRIGALKANENDDTLIVAAGGRVETANLGGGTNSVTLDDGRVDALVTYEGDDTVVFEGAGRSDSLNLGSGNNRVTVADGSVKSVVTYEGDDVLRGGQGPDAGRIDLADLGSGDDTVDSRGSRFGALRMGDGDDAVTIRNGAEAVSLGSGADTLDVLGGFVANVTGFDGPHTIRVAGGSEVTTMALFGPVDLTVDGARIDTANLGGDSADTVTVSNGGSMILLHLDSGDDRLRVEGADSRIDTVRASGGNDVVRILGDASVDVVNVGQGDNEVYTGNRFVEAIVAHTGNQTVVVGSGSAGTVKLGEGTHRVTANGFVESLNTFGESRVVIQTKGEGAGALRLADGNDKVTTGGGWVEYIRTRDGNDVVKVGRGGGETVSTGDGNDRVTVARRVDYIHTSDGNDAIYTGTEGGFHIWAGSGDDFIKLRAFTPDFGMAIWGGPGVDTLDVARIGRAATVDLEISGFQNIGAPGGDLSAEGRGYVSLSGIENLVGTARGDTLSGRDAANRLEGGGGADTLDGRAGDDTVNGGAGADVLTGGDGSDLFEFRVNDGTDEITDFEPGVDQIAFRGARGLGQIDFEQQGDDVLLTYQRSQVLVREQTVAAMEEAENFAF